MTAMTERYRIGDRKEHERIASQQAESSIYSKATMATRGRRIDEDEMAELSREAVEHLARLKINFVAIDFDQTIIDIHTGGKWNGTAAELATHIRPHFRHFLRAAADASLHLAVVTFTPQVGFVSDVLRTHFPSFADQVVIRGRDGSWSYEGRGSRNGKQGFMASAAEELGTKHPHVDITKNTTVLIDDDANNIRIALMDGTRAVWLDPRRPDRLFRDVMEMR